MSRPAFRRTQILAIAAILAKLSHDARQEAADAFGAAFTKDNPEFKGMRHWLDTIEDARSALLPKIKPKRYEGDSTYDTGEKVGLASYRRSMVDISGLPPINTKKPT